MTTVAGWATLLVMLAVGGLGLKISLFQYGNMSGVLLDLERRSAESFRASLERRLDEDESRILESILAAAQEPSALAALKEKEPLAHDPFLLLQDGTLVTPLLGMNPERRSAPPDEATPEAYERAMVSVWGLSPHVEKARALDEAARAVEAAPPWKLRARAQALAMEARSGEAVRALEGYRVLFEEFTPILLAPTAGVSPTYLQLTAARADCAEAARDSAGAAAVTIEALEKLSRGEIKPRFAEEQFFLGMAKERFARLGSPQPPVVARIQAQHEEKKLTLAVFETLRDWVLARSRVESLGPDDGRPRHLLEERGSGPERQPVFVVWARPGPTSSSSGAVAAGFRARPEDLEALLYSAASSSASGLKFVVTAFPHPPGDGFLDLTGFHGDRSFVRIGVDRKAWDRVVGGARQPFLFAGVLTAVLVGLLGMGLLVFLRGVRREIALSRMKTEFVANVSHELKTPLALIRLFGETLLLGRGDPESREKYCRIITRESERLTHLISSVLSFASIEAGKKRYDLKPCDIAQVVRDTYESYRFHLDEKGFSHRLECPAEVPEALADANAIAEAVINLLDNAVKYSKDRKEITVRVDSPDAWVRVSVEDRGVGISTPELRRVFEDYYRTREARALGTRGSGLGLSLVQHIVRAHGGRVELESRLGEGSVFTLLFPATPGSRKTIEAETPLVRHGPDAEIGP